MRPPTCFIAGLYSSKWGRLGRAYNIIKMTKYVYLLLKAGVVPIAPNVFYWWMAHLQPQQFWLVGTEKLAQVCDIMFMVPGWEASEGATAEFNSAKMRNQLVFQDVNDVKSFIALQRGASNHTESVS